MKAGTTKGGSTKAGTTKVEGPGPGRAASDSFRRVRPRGIVQICIFIHGEIPVPKRPSKDCRELFLEVPADTPRRRESGASGHRAR